MRRRRWGKSCFQAIELLEKRALLADAAAVFHADINFQPAKSPVPSGYIVDAGAKFGSRGNGFSYGWNRDISADTRDRNSKLSADQRYDTFIHMQKAAAATWEIAVPNGTYTVDLAAGDATATDSNYRINVEGNLLLNGKPSSAKHWVESSGTVVVSDGRLTVSCASGAVNDKIDFITIDLVPPPPPPPPPPTDPVPPTDPTPPPVDPPPTDPTPPPTDPTPPPTDPTNPPPVDPGPETVQVSAPDSSASEANLDPGDFLFTRTGPTDQDLTVNYQLSGTATADADYAALPGSVVIPAGQSSVDLPLIPIDDDALEPAESVIVQLGSGNYSAGTSQSATVTIIDNETSSSEQPYSGSPAQLSATIQAEDFDQGPAGVSYADKTPGNSGGVYRSTDIDIAPTADTGGGVAVVNIQQAEWMKYTVNVPLTGTYNIETRVASTTGGSRFHISFDGTSTGGQTIPNTGGSENWTTLLISTKLNAGIHAMKFYVDSATTASTNVGSLNYIRIDSNLPPTPTPKTYSSFSPGSKWNDTDGNAIQAHGGDMLYQNGVYYWYGEDKATPTYIEFGEPHVDVIGISVYTSTDLYNWTNHGLALSGTSTGDLAPANVLERPKVLYNASTGKYVMWMHVDSADYSKANVGIATSDSPLGPFVYQGSFKPDGLDSRDMTVFQDDDGTAYVIFATNHNREIRIAEMTSDYLGLTGDIVQPYVSSTQREAPQMIKHDGEYFLITSGATWFAPNAAMYAYSSSPMGKYTIVGNPAHGSLASTTYNSQGAFVFQVAGTDNFIFMADRWNTANLGASTYVWLPMRINGTTLSIDNPSTWDLSTFG